MVLAQLLTSYVVALALLALAAAIGDRVRATLFSDPMTGVERAFVGLAIGLGVVAYLVFAMGLIGAYRRGWFIALIVALAVASHRSLGELWRSRVAIAGTVLSVTREVRGFPFVLWTSVALLLLLAALGIGAPLTNGDTMASYLGYPREYIAAGRLVPFPAWEPLAMVPATGVMLHTLMWGLGGETLAVAFMFVMACLVPVTFMLLFQRVFTPRVAVLSGLLFLSTPVVVEHLQTPRVDFLVAFFASVTGYAVYRALQLSSRERLRWMLLAGVCLGVGMTVKLTLGVFLALLVAGLAGMRLLRLREDAPSLQHIAALAAMTVLIASPWFIRSWWWTGNPVWPFLNPLLSRFAEVRAYAGDGATWGFELKPWTYYVTLPWTFVFDVSKGVAHAAFLAYLPMWLSASRRRRLASMVVAFCLLFFLALGHAVYVPRYNLPIIGFLCLLTAYQIEQFSRIRMMARLNAVFLSVLAMLALALTARTAILYLPVVVGLESRAHFLERTNFEIYHDDASGEALSESELIGIIMGATGHTVFTDDVRFSAPCATGFQRYRGDAFCENLAAGRARALTDRATRYIVEVSDVGETVGRHPNTTHVRRFPSGFDLYRVSAQ